MKHLHNEPHYTWDGAVFEAAQWCFCGLHPPVYRDKLLLAV